MRYTHKDGELRICSGVTELASSKGAYPIYEAILFTNADLNIPLGRPRPEELVNTDRGNVNTNTSHAEGSDEAILAPQPFSISCKLDDTTYTQYLLQMLSGCTGATIGTSGSTPYLQLNSKKVVSAKGQASGVSISSGTTYTTPAFADTMKMAFNVEVIWNTTGTDNGRFLGEVYFPPEGQTIVEAEDVVNLNLNGQVYGDIQPISSFFGAGPLAYGSTTAGNAFSGTTIRRTLTVP
jgi:hypothetical protein